MFSSQTKLQLHATDMQPSFTQCEGSLTGVCSQCGACHDWVAAFTEMSGTATAQSLESAPDTCTLCVVVCKSSSASMAARLALDMCITHSHIGLEHACSGFFLQQHNDSQYMLHIAHVHMTNPAVDQRSIRTFWAMVQWDCQTARTEWDSCMPRTMRSNGVG